MNDDEPESSVENPENPAGRAVKEESVPPSSETAFSSLKLQMQIYLLQLHLQENMR